MQKHRPDHYKIQRLALLPTIDTSSTNVVYEELANLSELNLQEFFTFIIDQGLHFFWLDFLRTSPTPSFLCSAQQRLKQQCFKDTTRYLAQKKSILDLDILFASTTIPYVVIKGAHIREEIYQNPACRPSVDIDILVSPTDKTRAIHILAANGFTLTLDPANVNHEVSLTRQNTCRADRSLSSGTAKM